MAARTISSAWVKGIVDLFQGVGLDARALFEEAGLEIDELKNPDVRFAPEKISRLWDLAVERSGNPAIGLAMPDVAHPGNFDALTYLMMSCPHVLAAFERLLRYIRIVSDAADIAIIETDGGYDVTLALFGAGQPVPRARIEFVLITILNFCRWLMARDIRPLAVDFPYPAPADLQPYVDAFHCPLKFEMPVHCLHFAAADLTAPLPTSNPLLEELHERFAGQYASRLDRDRISYQVRAAIVRRLPAGDPMRMAIAGELCMSERTLQRRLQEEGTSFNQLVEDTRRELAQEYLGRDDLALAQVAYFLGFADQSTFFRASRRWFAMSPGEYRSRLKKDAEPGGRRA